MVVIRPKFTLSMWLHQTSDFVHKVTLDRILLLTNQLASQLMGLIFSLMLHETWPFPNKGLYHGLTFFLCVPFTDNTKCLHFSLVTGFIVEKISFICCSIATNGTSVNSLFSAQLIIGVHIQVLIYDTGTILLMQYTSFQQS